jgi:negative regulator of flagellin synthesis FlgM
MKVVPGLSAPGVSAAAPVSDTASVDSTVAPVPASAPGTLQSATLQPALAALRELPDVDNAKVAALRDALAKGQLPFDSAKLAALIERYHRGVK